MDEKQTLEIIAKHIKIESQRDNFEGFDISYYRDRDELILSFYTGSCKYRRYKYLYGELYWEEVSEDR